ncbi:MAG: hypothetical protein C4560_12150 [Nitrospiraceae bacterium]|nr:MAG: hypothetical protein C4560_12150 [Nitrospiraceae bacterium]
MENIVKGNGLIKYKKELFEKLKSFEHQRIKWFYYCDDSKGITVRLYDRNFFDKHRNLYEQEEDTKKISGDISRPGYIVLIGKHLGEQGEEIKNQFLHGECFQEWKEAKNIKGQNANERFEYFAKLNSQKSLESKKIEDVHTIDKGLEHISAEGELTIYPDEISDIKKYKEGSVTTVVVDRYERDPTARKECISHYGIDCIVCGFNFGKVYGKIGEGFIHVHHVKPLSEIRQEYEVNPIEDLCPVCPNCHAMLHQGESILDIDDLRKLINKT